MRKGYRVIFETIDLDNPSEPLEQTTLYRRNGECAEQLFGFFTTPL